MANLKSSKKDIRRSLRRKEANSQKKSRLRTCAKNLLKALKTGDLAESQRLYVSFSSLLDKAAKVNLIHQRNADRNKSRMAIKLNALKTVQN